MDKQWLETWCVKCWDKRHGIEIQAPGHLMKEIRQWVLEPRKVARRGMDAAALQPRNAQKWKNWDTGRDIESVEPRPA